MKKFRVELTESGQEIFNQLTESIELGTVEPDTEAFTQMDIQIYTPLALVAGELDECGIDTEQATMESLIQALKERMEFEEFEAAPLFDGFKLKPEWFTFKEITEPKETE